MSNELLRPNALSYLLSRASLLATALHCLEKIERLLIDFLLQVCHRQR